MSRCYRPNGSGDLNLGFTKDDSAENVRENRTRFLQSLRADSFTRFVLLLQRHTPVLHAITRSDEAVGDFLQPATLEGDAAMTDVPGVLLTVQNADCVPVLLMDPARPAVAALHAGWRGTLERIVENGVGRMRAAYGSDPARIVAAIGPSIGPRSYAVGDEVNDAFLSRFRYGNELFHTAGGLEPGMDRPQRYLDLWEANRRQLLDAGVAAENITVLGEDTATKTDRFFSHRAEAGFTGRMMSAIGLRP